MGSFSQAQEAQESMEVLKTLSYCHRNNDPIARTEFVKQFRGRHGREPTTQHFQVLIDGELIEQEHKSDNGSDMFLLTAKARARLDNSYLP